MTPQERVRLASLGRSYSSRLRSLRQGSLLPGEAHRTGPSGRASGTSTRLSTPIRPMQRHIPGWPIATNMLGYYTLLPPKEATQTAQAAARKALELDTMLAEPHTSLAWTDFIFPGLSPPNGNQGAGQLR